MVSGCHATYAKEIATWLSVVSCNQSHIHKQLLWVDSEEADQLPRCFEQNPAASLPGL